MVTWVANARLHEGDQFMAVLRDSIWGSDRGSDYALVILGSSDVGCHCS